MRNISRLLFFGSFFFFLFVAFAQNGKAVLSGIITDEHGRPVDLVDMGAVNLSRPVGTTTDKNGKYHLQLPADVDLTIRLSHPSYRDTTWKIRLKVGETRVLNIGVKDANIELQGTTVTGKINKSNVTALDPMIARQMTSISGGVEALVKSLPGVNSNNELSSQYSVRGGNYDENLVYVNDIEVYRPLLTRSGEQEGLSFINPDLVSGIQFSGGGFEAKYGDKLSSILDVQYKKPSRFEGSVGLNLLGASLYLGGTSKNDKFSCLFGLRQKSNQYILKGLQTKGDYKPSFTDIQTLLTYRIDKKNELSFLGNIGLNSYRFTPSTRETRFGTVQVPMMFKVYFEGQEVDKFQSYFGALSWTHQTSERFKNKLTISAFRSLEKETFDILGEYWLSDVSTDVNSANYGEATYVKGIGAYLNHARNSLDAIVGSVEYRGSYIGDVAVWQWGAKAQYEDIVDNLDEWRLIDSAGYSVPMRPMQPGDPNPDKEAPRVQDFTQAKNHTQSLRASLFGQASFDFNSNQKYVLTAGVRVVNWTYNSEWIVSPRLQFSFKPESKADMRFRFSVGHYAQPPFYREIRDIYGEVHSDVLAQKSIHTVAGMDWYFRMMNNRPFKLTVEAYYKYLYDMNPYEIDNVRIRYYAQNASKGYATGLDVRLNGEFVPGIESWIGFSLMSTKERIKYQDQGVWKETSLIPRPTDQLFAVNLLFQDYYTSKRNLGVFVNMVYAVGLPFGPTESLSNPALFEQRTSTRLPDYKRVDVGISYQLIGNKSKMSKKNPLYYLKAIWIGLEVFNIFQMKNTISYEWVSLLNGGQYAVPNQLTPRQLNVKLTVDF